MGKKIFVSYKYSDANVRPIPGLNETTARDYVDKLQEMIEGEDHINKGENDGEDLSSLEDATIGSKLGDKIYDSTLTIVLISRNMKDVFLQEKDQWIPWEISYSLKEQTRDNKTSKTNAVLAVVLPDLYSSYDYFIVDNSCPYCNCRILNTDFLFDILRRNMFNHKSPQPATCPNHIGSTPYQGYVSYIQSVKWDDFIKDINKHIDIAMMINSDIANYNIVKNLS